MHIIKYLYISIIFCGLCSCSTETLQPNTDTIGSNYFPLEKGSFRIYDVIEIEHVFASENDTSAFQLKEVVADSFVNLEGGLSHLIHRFKRSQPEDNWTLDSVWSARKTGNFAVMTENNVPLMKMVFPLQEGKSWDGNSLNGKDTDEYTMTDVFRSYTLADSVVVDKSVFIVQENENDNLLFRDIRHEVYGEDIGMLYKESIQLQYCAETNCIGQEIIETGRELKMWLTAYGNE